MDKRTFKNKVYEELAKVAKAMANPRRMEIMDLLAQGPFSVEQIAQQTQMSIANASQHLQVLKAARLVEIARKGTFIFYHLPGENVFEAWRAVRELGMQQNAEVKRIIQDFRSDPHQLESVTFQELQQKIASDGVIVLDVRPEEEFRRCHIHQALSIPIDQLALRIEELPKTSEIIAYCRGPLCVYADEAVKMLTDKGYKAKRLAEGFPDWQAEGLPVASSA
ncbi:MAG: ArsR/SmtB family transcription factor [Cyclobacteriaceae bacterium]